MVRPAFVLALLIATAITTVAMPARASQLPGRIGLYTGAAQRPLPMLDSKIDIEVHGAIVEAVIEQRFRNDLDRTTEATYIFPLPADAAVTAMAIHAGSRTITAAIERRDQAHERYEAAISAGLAAALLDQERPDVFTQAVAAIPPKGEVTVRLRFDFTASYRAGAWELVLPLVIAPRYVPGSATGRPTVGGGSAPDTDRSPDASRVTPGGAPGAGGKTRVAVRFAEAVEDVASPTHEIAKHDRTYDAVDPKSDHDLIVRWRANVPQNGWVEQDGEAAFAAVVLEAPAAAAAKRAEAVRMMLVVDRAATTRGDADLVERPLVHALLGHLGAADRAAIAGSDAIEWGVPDQVAQKLDEAWQHAAPAFDLTAVLGQLRAKGAAVVLVSDGLVADDAAAIAAARKVGRPIHVVGVGPAPNRSLLAAIAATTGGTVRFAAVDSDPAALASEVVADLVTPPALLSVNWGTLAASDVVPANLPRLGAGQATLVVARVKRAQQANARARGDVFMLGTIDTPHSIEGATTTLGPLGRRWAKLKLDELVAAGNADAIAAHALRYGLVSPQTSMVAVGADVVVKGGVKHSVSVPVSVPEGMHWQEVQQQTKVEFDATGGDSDGDADTKTSDVAKKQTEEQKQDKLEDEDRQRDQWRAKANKGATKKPQDGRAPQHERGKQTGKEASGAGTGAPVVDNTRTFSRPAGGESTLAPTAQTPPTATVQPTMPPPAEPKAKAEADNESENDDNEPRRVPAPDVATAGAAEGYDEEDARSEVMVTADSAEAPPMGRRAFRLSLGLGGGAAVERHRGTQIDSLAALSARIDVGRRTLFGLEGSLWLVGTEPEGELLFTGARRGIARWLELRGGLGLHLGGGVGPAANLTLRTRLPIRDGHRHWGTFLRYDGALLRHDDGSRSGQNTTSFGVETSW